jgi:ABC-type multidrug transport system ATPase subunit
LDPETQKKALNFLKAFRDQGNTILLTSHFFSGLHEIVTDIALLDNRQIISAGSVDDFLVNQLASEWKEVLSTFF